MQTGQLKVAKHLQASQQMRSDFCCCELYLLEALNWLNIFLFAALAGFYSWFSMWGTWREPGGLALKNCWQGPLKFMCFSTFIYIFLQIFNHPMVSGGIYFWLVVSAYRSPYGRVSLLIYFFTLFYTSSIYVLGCPSILRYAGPMGFNMAARITLNQTGFPDDGAVRDFTSSGQIIVTERGYLEEWGLQDFSLFPSQISGLLSSVKDMIHADCHQCLSWKHWSNCKQQKKLPSFPCVQTCFSNLCFE